MPSAPTRTDSRLGPICRWYRHLVRSHRRGPRQQGTVKVRATVELGGPPADSCTAVVHEQYVGALALLISPVRGEPARAGGEVASLRCAAGASSRLTVGVGRRLVVAELFQEMGADCEQAMVVCGAPVGFQGRRQVGPGGRAMCHRDSCAVESDHRVRREVLQQAYRARICGQLVASTCSASSWTAAIAACSRPRPCAGSGRSGWAPTTLGGSTGAAAPGSRPGAASAPAFAARPLDLGATAMRPSRRRRVRSGQSS